MMTLWIIKAGLPFSLVENEHFTEFLSYLAPWYEPPIRKTAKRAYRSLCKEKKASLQELLDRKILIEAESYCHRFLRLNGSSSGTVTNDINMDTWAQFLGGLFNSRSLGRGESLNLKSLLPGDLTDDLHFAFLSAEVELALGGMKNRKAPGPDNLQNEVVRLLWAALPDEITAFLNVSLELGSFPVAWKNSNLKLLYKGKGAVSDVNSYRGISLCCSLYNLLDRVMNNRLYSSLIDLIPSNQFGFVKGRSTIQAMQLLVDEINFVVYEKKTPLYALFLDVKKAFDSVSRHFIFEELVGTGRFSVRELNLLAEMLDANFLTVRDGVSVSEPIVQSNGHHGIECLVEQRATLNSTLPIVVTLHFIDESSRNLMSVALAVRQMVARSTAPELINTIQLILREFGLKKNQIRSTCSDRGANIKKACTDLFGTNKTVFCLCHLVDNAVQTSLSEVRPVQSFINDVKSVVTFIKRSPTAANLLRKYQLADGRIYSMCLMPIQSVATRWNSVLHCAKRYVLLHHYITKVLQDSSLSSSNPPPVILQECIKTLDEVIKVLEPVEQLTLTFSSSKNWTGSFAVIAFKSLAHTIKCTNLTEPVAKMFKDVLLKNLSDINAHVEDNVMLGAANVLDPRFKGASLKKEQYAKAIGLIKVDVEEYKERGNGADSDNLPFLDDSGEDILMSYFQAKDPLPKRARKTQDEINEYLNSPLEPYQCTPNEWWDLHESDFPRLSAISKSFLMIPPSSVASERLVSSINLVLKAEKSRMLSQRLAKLVFLRNLPETFWQRLIS
ncbi:Hypothetical predicted protein [Cloeon dipterum]|uniref:HAT C-terminal dimerisation domain-containing protein n=1 Tax=Cloeon dipterum TaxID=197152 RepID=A0A8S1E0J8_9INSE|nr:Hypothetical predicted protein [Cloeon dipterum]